MKKRLSGFTLLEIIIVVAILGILAGISVPYYQDYVGDSRQAALKQNVSNLRKVLEDFKGDHGRGIYRGTVWIDVTSYNCDYKSANNELVAGVIPTVKLYKDGKITFRRNKYINAIPILEDMNGQPVTISPASHSIVWGEGGAGALGTHAGEFEQDKDDWYYDLDGNLQYNSSYDRLGSGTEARLALCTSTYTADITWFDFIDSKGTKY